MTVIAILGVLLALVLFGFYLSWRATRLHRLHHRVDTARAALDAALSRRLTAVLDLLDAGGVEEGGELAEAARAVGTAERDRRDLAESTLSRVLRESLESPEFRGSAERWDGLRSQLTEVEAAAKGVHMARTFYNDAVSDTRLARRSRLVRMLRIAGTAPLPDYFEIDDQPPRIPLLPIGPDTP